MIICRWNWERRDTNRCEESSWCYRQTGELLDVNRTNPIDHFTQSDFTRRDETTLVLFGDAALVTREHDEVTLGLADEEHVLFDGGDSRAPDSLVVSTNFYQFVVGAVLALGPLDDAHALH